MSAPEGAKPPPTYDEVMGRGSSAAPPLARRERNGIPPEDRRSMEDERRPLPEGWVRSYDPQNAHQFFVDTRQDPPRSIWHHPLDDETYLNSLDPAEREHVGRLRREWSWNDVEAESTDEEGDDDGHHGGGHGLLGLGHGKKHDQKQAPHAEPQPQAGGPQSQAGEAPISAPHRLGRRMKDALTGTTHEQRNQQRDKRAQRERDLYQQHRIYRRGLEAALRTGQPQLLGEDDAGQEVYLLPPNKSYQGVENVKRLSPSVLEYTFTSGWDQRGGGGGGRPARFVTPDDGGYGGGLGGGLGGRGLGGGYPGGLYGGRYGRPYAPYGRPYGMGYGGGMGFPMMAPMFGGMMLGGLLF
ncbi:Uu.00g092030.m01.CDS01 [Anthostomella pinea]|uniref:Uu.00g092030.m01.CDS01 n=1 Tax=Anthostomella pinea TaxID=933095 RepID=A0AAI8VNU7_9PEZI|nr:Uu.00g092030.m01.CDS01 [Anthostomella pinea]